jgi:Co/Zn/Cd efflux system component
MLGDAIVYGFSLYVIDRGAVWQARAALPKGIIMAVFGIGLVVQVAVKVLQGLTPTVEVMGAVGGLAFAANLVCLVAAATVAVTGSPWPDIIIGLLVAGVFGRSSLHVIRDASRAVAPTR